MRTANPSNLLPLSGSAQAEPIPSRAVEIGEDAYPPALWSAEARRADHARASRLADLHPSQVRRLIDYLDRVAEICATREGIVYRDRQGINLFDSETARGIVTYVRATAKGHAFGSRFGIAVEQGADPTRPEDWRVMVYVKRPAPARPDLSRARARL